MLKKMSFLHKRLMTTTKCSGITINRIGQTTKKECYLFGIRFISRELIRDTRSHQAKFLLCLEKLHSLIWIIICYFGSNLRNSPFFSLFHILVKFLFGPIILLNISFYFEPLSGCMKNIRMWQTGSSYKLYFIFVASYSIYCSQKNLFFPASCWQTISYGNFHQASFSLTWVQIKSFRSYLSLHGFPSTTFKRKINRLLYGSCVSHFYNISSHFTFLHRAPFDITCQRNFFSFYQLYITDADTFSTINRNTNLLH